MHSGKVLCSWLGSTIIHINKHRNSLVLTTPCLYIFSVMLFAVCNLQKNWIEGDSLFTRDKFAMGIVPMHSHRSTNMNSGFIFTRKALKIKNYNKTNTF